MTTDYLCEAVRDLLLKFQPIIFILSRQKAKISELLGSHVNQKAKMIDIGSKSYEVNQKINKTFSLWSGTCSLEKALPILQSNELKPSKDEKFEPLSLQSSKAHKQFARQIWSSLKGQLQMEKEKKLIKIHLITDNKLTLDLLRKSCESYFIGKQSYEVQYGVTNTSTINQGQESLRYLLSHILNAALYQGIFVLFQSNRLFQGSESQVNSYSKILNANKPGHDRYNGCRLFLFDGQSYLHPYQLNIPSWTIFNNYFYNYWYVNKDPRLNMPTQYGGRLSQLSVMSIHAFLSYNLERIELPIERFHIFMSRRTLETVNQQKLQKIQEILRANLTGQQIEQIKCFLSDLFTVETVQLLKESLEKAFLHHQNNIVIFDDTLSFQFQKNPERLIIKYQDFQRNHWRQIVDDKAGQYKGFSTGLINPYYAKQFQAFNQEDHNLTNFTYINGLTAGNLLHILHLRYGSAYMKRNPNTNSSPNKNKK